ncbi:MAG: DNA repair exonuclease [Clostridia bacterium]|nr:DNA repair exonuclease [Clostridia bacterium]
MKLIHAADLHLGSRLSSTFPKEIADKRKAALRNSFLDMIHYAKREGISVILLSGDVFDSDHPSQKDRDFFYDAVRGNPDVDFLYLRGNHDTEGDRPELENLKTFSGEWSSYRYGDVVISGIEITRDNAVSLYTSLSLDSAKKNIVMLHGQVGSGTDADTVNLLKLRDKSIDYLALGHIHSYGVHEFDKRGVAVYSGCLEGRGFDETGEKGFVVVEVTDTVKHTFIPFSKSPIYLVKLDISAAATLYEVTEAAKKMIRDRNAIYRLELVGSTALADDPAGDVQNMLEDDCAFISVKNRSKKKIDFTRYLGESSLCGEFVRTVLGSGDYTDEEKTDIILYGLKALEGREVLE